MKTEREAFEEAYSAIHPITPTKMTARLIWQAACAWQREQDAKVCDDIESREWNAYKGRSDEDRHKLGSSYWEGVSDGAGNCAAAIRAQGER